MKQTCKVRPCKVLSHYFIFFTKLYYFEEICRTVLASEKLCNRLKIRRKQFARLHFAEISSRDKVLTKEALPLFENDTQNDYHHTDDRLLDALGCSGNVRSCVTSNVDVTVTLQHPQEDGIYSNLITREKSFWGSANSVLGGGQITMSSGIRWIYTCAVCRCTCDSHSSTFTVRSFYLGEIRAPSGYVVTGTRFVQHIGAIFLQIQVGKLVAPGSIDQDNVQWQSLPYDFEYDHYFSLTYDKDTVLFNPDCPDADGVAALAVIGFIFEEYQFGVRLRTIKKPIASLWMETRAFSQYTPRFTGSHSGDCYQTPEPLISSWSDAIPGLNRDIPMKPENIIRTRLIGVRFEKSSLDHDDGQSCVPYFDGSAINRTVKVTLSRIDFIQYTNDKNYAGFIRPKLIPLNGNCN